MKLFVLLALSLLVTQGAFARKPVRLQCTAAVKCAAPPKGCEWSMEVDKKGCISGCGELSCEIQCPAVPSCAAPPEGCNWQMEQDPNGCIIGCGKLICDTQICPDISCAAPPEGCNWNMQYDENKCPTCGTLICEPAGGGGYDGPMDGPNGMKQILDAQ